MSRTQAEHTPPSLDERRRRERRFWLRGLALSAVVHALVFLLWPVHSIPLSPYSAAGDPANDPLAASGSSMQALNLATPTPAPEIPSVPVPIPVEIEIEPIEFEEPSIEVELPEAGGGPALEAPGLGRGAGRGDAGTGAEGLNRMVPPSPRGMIIPPSNDRLRDREVEVWVFVDAQGRVVADSTRLVPPTSDSDFNRLLIQEAARWIFRPATRGGQPVATWFPYRISG